MKTNWQTKKLGDVCDKASSNISQNQLNEKKGDYPIYGAGGFIQNINFFHQDKEYISIVKDGAGIGRVSLLPAFSSVIGTSQYLLPKEDVHIRYLYYFLLNLDFWKYKSGSTIPHLYFKDYSEESIGVPPLPEQLRIVKILDEVFDGAGRVKENAERNFENSRLLFESYLSEVFSNPKGDWGEKNIEEVADVVGGFSFKSTDFKKAGQYQVIRMGNVRPGIIRENESPVFIENLDDKILKRALLQKDDVIITQTGTKNKRDYGFTVIIDKDNYLLNQRISAIRFSNKYLPKFFLYFSWTDYFRNQYFANETGTVGQGNVGITAITKARIPLPPLPEQKAIVVKLDALSAETKKLEGIYRQKIADVDELKKSVLKKAFSGEV